MQKQRYIKMISNQNITDHFVKKHDVYISTSSYQGIPRKPSCAICIWSCNRLQDRVIWYIWQTLIFTNINMYGYWLFIWWKHSTMNLTAGAQETESIVFNYCNCHTHRYTCVITKYAYLKIQCDIMMDEDKIAHRLACLCILMKARIITMLEI